jgi:hypothetical protein
MDVSLLLVADLHAPEAVELRERLFDYPAIASQWFLDSTPQRAMRG